MSYFLLIYSLILVEYDLRKGTMRGRFFERLPVKNVFILPVHLIICLGIASNVVEKSEAILAPDPSM